MGKKWLDMELVMLSDEIERSIVFFFNEFVSECLPTPVRELVPNEISQHLLGNSVTLPT